MPGGIKNEVHIIMEEVGYGRFFPKEDKLLEIIRKRRELYYLVEPYLSSAKIDGRWRAILMEGAPPELQDSFKEYQEAGHWLGEYRLKYGILPPRV
ncbi:MAG: hypothetical protein QM296_10320 [Bacillota bacterium]|nr:hypothetical protein [Bacillota bacterium]